MEETADGFPILFQKIQVESLNLWMEELIRSLLFAPLSLAVILSLTSGTASRHSNPAQASTPDVKVIEVNLSDARVLAMFLASDFESEEETRLLAENYGAVRILDKAKLCDELIPAILQTET